MKSYDIGYAQALELSLRSIAPLAAECIPAALAIGRIPAEDVRAVIHAPSVDSSIKDGYAVVAEDIEYATADAPVMLDVLGRIEAGSEKRFSIARGQAVRVLTGASLPAGCDAVLADEFTEKIDAGHIRALSHSEKDRNILPRGTDIRCGETIAAAGRMLTPSMVGLLVAGGVMEVPAHKRPRIGLLATGDEVLLPGETLGEGKLYASNVALQDAWLRSVGFATRIAKAGDRVGDLTDKVSALLAESDALLTSGGAWKGDRDLIVKTLDDLGWDMRFHRARMGPGKAVAMGVIDGKPVFCLPGGPPSNEMAFLMIAFPALCRLAGYRQSPFPQLTGILDTRVSGQIDWTQFKHCVIEKKDGLLHIKPLKMKSRLMSMARAHGIFMIPEGVEELPVGSAVPFICLDPSALAGPLG